MPFRNLKTARLLTLIILIYSINVFAQPSEKVLSRDQYIEMWKDEAIKQMVEHNIPASITLAQGILESGNGNSELAKYANNHFGIKCHNWTGEKMYKDDDHKDDCFRKYQSAEESFRDHSVFLTGRDRYSFLFNYEITDYKSWAKGLKEAGYATNPKYPSLLIDLIEKNNLQQYDQLHELAIGKDPKKIESSSQTKPFTVSMSGTTVNAHIVNVSSNKVKYINIKKGDTFYKVSKEFGVGLWQLYHYNDLADSDILREGEVLYLQPKRNKSDQKEHTVTKNDTMRSISQKYGVKLKKLYKKNNMNPGVKLTPGMKISLR